MPSGSRHALVGVLLALLCASPATAQNPRPRSITLREALSLVAAHSPRLAASVPEREALEMRGALQALPPTASLELQLENFAGTGNTTGTDALEATLQLTRAIELGGKARLRRVLADAELSALDVRQHGRHIDLLAEASRRFVHVLADQETLAAVRRSVQLAQQALAAVQARVTAGAASPAARSRAQIALARANIELEHAEHELAASRVMLAATWGAERADFDAVAGSFYALPAPEPLERYSERLERNPELLQLASEQRVLQARARLSAAQRRANPVVSLGVRHLAPFDDQALVAGVLLPLGAGRRAALESDAVAAEQRGNAHAHEARRIELAATLFALYQEILHARTEAEAIATHIRPEAARMLGAVETGYRAGRFSLIELADAQRQLLEIERDQIRAAAEFHTHLIEIERLTGVAMQLEDGGRTP